MNPHHLLTSLLLSGSLLGCTSFQHQTTELEPHALITVIKPWENQPGVLKSLDGLPVSAGKTYRVRPGQHTVVMGFTELVTETAKPKTLFSVGNLAGAADDPPANARITEGRQVTVQDRQSFNALPGREISCTVAPSDSRARPAVVQRAAGAGHAAGEFNLRIPARAAGHQYHHGPGGRPLRVDR
jgi:hypothetical protein